MNDFWIDKILHDAFRDFDSSTKLVEKIKTGLSESEIYKISTGEDTYALKIFPKSYVSRVENQINITEELIKGKIPTPRIIKYNINFTKDKGYLVMEYVEGSTLHEYFEADNETVGMIGSCANTLSKIHSIKDTAPWQDKRNVIESKKSWIDYINKRQDSYKSIKDIDEVDHNKLRIKLTNFTKLLESSEIKLTPLHWDYNPQNIIIDSNQVVAVLDAESHKVGDPLADIGIFLYWLHLYKKENHIEEFIKSYSENDEFSYKIKGLVEGYATLQAIVALKYLHKNSSKKWEVVKIIELLNA